MTSNSAVYIKDTKSNIIVIAPDFPDFENTEYFNIKYILRNILCDFQ
ncbi:34177_t:CDS:1, partial [Racocetra persica]